MFPIIGIDDIEIDQVAVARHKTDAVDFSINCTLTNRDSCISCRNRFKRNEVRIIRSVYLEPESDHNQNDGVRSGQANWYHVDCFARLRLEIGWLCSGDLLPGFKRLSAEIQKVVRLKIP